MVINSKKKGNRVQLEMAKLLTKITGTKFQNVGVCSGSRYTSQGINSVGFNADVFSEDKKYENLVIEVKATKKVICVNEIFNHKSLLWSYIDQCKRQTPEGKDWLLIIKMNGRTPLFMCNSSPCETNYNIINNYPDIFKNSVPIVYGTYWLGELK